MDTIIDNQQVTEAQIAWLAGIWDGEGTFSIIKSGNKQRTSIYNTKATMENTSCLMVEECIKIFNGLGVKYYIYFRPRKSPKHKDRYVLSVCRMDMLKKFCDFLLPYLIHKKPQATLMKKFVEARLARKSPGRPVPYTDDELHWVAELRSLNSFGPTETSTTLRRTLLEHLRAQKRYTKLRDEKIKSDLYRDIQMPTEMIGT